MTTDPHERREARHVATSFWVPVLAPVRWLGRTVSGRRRHRGPSDVGLGRDPATYFQLWGRALGLIATVAALVFGLVWLVIWLA
ncbi:MAG: hypothetical protein R3C15_20095 [Thermoleophilia bacterium]